jgi:hypothetical protein
MNRSLTERLHRIRQESRAAAGSVTTEFDYAMWDPREAYDPVFNPNSSRVVPSHIETQLRCRLEYLAKSINPFSIPENINVIRPLFPKTVGELFNLTQETLNTLVTYHRWSLLDPLMETEGVDLPWGFYDHPCTFESESWMPPSVIRLSTDEERLYAKRMLFAHYIGAKCIQTTPGWWIMKITEQCEEVLDIVEQISD